MIYENLRPREVFKYFEEISNIPRSSGEEKAVSDYLVDFATKRNLEVIQDKMNNIIIKKPATSGYENIPAIIIQGHLDMVCEKTVILFTTSLKTLLSFLLMVTM